MCHDQKVVANQVIFVANKHYYTIMEKKIKMFFAAMFVASSTCLAQANYQDDYFNHSWEKDSGGNKMLTINYNPMTLIGTTEDLHAVCLEVTGLHSLSHQYPLYLDGGVGFGITFGPKITTGENSLDDEPNLFFLSVKIPLNVGYKIELDDDCFIFPYMGVYVRGNIAGSYLSEGSTLDAFSKERVGENNVFKYIQAGYGCGVKLAVGHFCMGFGYERDVNEIAYKNKSASNKISFGYRF